MTSNPSVSPANVSDAPLPPVVDGTPLMQGHNSLEFYLEQYRRVGPIFRVSIMGHNFTVLAGPEGNLFVSRMGTDYLVSGEFWKEFDKQVGVQNQRDGEPHSRMRKLKRRGYARSAFLPHLPEVVKMTQDTLHHWLPDDQPGKSVVLLDMLRHIVADQLGLFLNRQLPGEYFDDVLTYMHTLIKATLTRQLPPSALTSPEFLKAKARVIELGQTVIAAHRRDKDEDYEPNLIDDLIAAAEAGEPQLDKDNLAHAPLGPFAAGLDTVANSCAFLMYALLKHPDVLARVRAEADQVLSSGPLTPEKLEGLTALHGTAMETLRMYPVAPVLMFNAKQPFVFAGYRVDQGESITVATTVSHNLPELFPNPTAFDIDRYHEPRNEHRQNGAFAPFGLGTHTCLGAGIAEVQLMVIPAVLLYSADLVLDPPDYALKIVADPTLTPGGNMKVQLQSWRHLA